MASLVQFDTTKFDFAHEPPNPINPIHGESVLRWIQQELESPFQFGEPFAEDWGWCCDVLEEDDRYLLGASAEPNDDGSWHVMIQVEPRRSMMDKLSGKKAPYDALAPAIAEEAMADPDNRNLELEGSR
jgi:hypothetical protein